jgi:hypothetical protein
MQALFDRHAQDIQNPKKGTTGDCKSNEKEGKRLDSYVLQFAFLIIKT